MLLEFTECEVGLIHAMLDETEDKDLLQTEVMLRIAKALWPNEEALEEVESPVRKK